MRDYSVIYERLTAPLRQRPWTIKLLQLINSSLTKLMYMLYPCLLLYLSLEKGWHALLVSLLVPAVCFVCVSLFRSWYNRPRPYETWSIQPLIIKKTQGHSLPSRHVFSAVLVSLTWYQVSPVFAIALLVVSAFLALCRVLGGVHYPSDVILGYLLGALSGVLTIILT